jgi:hypothetical protein
MRLRDDLESNSMNYTIPICTLLNCDLFFFFKIKEEYVYNRICYYIGEGILFDYFSDDIFITSFQHHLHTE